MALLFIDGFEGYGILNQAVASLMGSRGWTSVSAQTKIQLGRLYGYSIYYNGSVWACTAPPSLTTDPTLISGFSFFSGSNLTAEIDFYSNATLGINVSFTTTNAIIKFGATTIATYPIILQASVHYYAEVKVFCHPTSGTVEVRLNSATIASLSGINTQQAAESYNTTIRFFMGQYTCLDDVYICDGAGTACNDFLGVCKIIGIFPNADSTILNWTPSTGTTHYALVDENPANTTDYVSSSTQGQIDLYSYPSLFSPYGSGTILGLQISTSVLLSAGTSIILESLIVSNGVYDVGSDFQVTSASVVDQKHISMTDPNTGSQWTLANLAAAQIGIKAI
jgi:hypothetical protein